MPLPPFNTSGPYRNYEFGIGGPSMTFAVAAYRGAAYGNLVLELGDPVVPALNLAVSALNLPLVSGQPLTDFEFAAERSWDVDGSRLLVGLQMGSPARPSLHALAYGYVRRG